MSQEFKFTDPGEGLHEGEVLEVHVSEGDQVEDGDVVLTVETDKASTDVPAPFTGTIVNFSDMIDIVNKEVDEVIYGNKTAQEGMDSAAEQIQTAGIELSIRGAN